MPENEYLLNKVKVLSDNKSVNTDEAETYIKQKPNKRILGFFRFHLMVYNLAHLGKERKWKTKLGSIVGEEPVIFSQFTTEKSSSQISSYLRNKGYYYNHVSDSAKIKKKKKNVYYLINAGEPYRINEVKYKTDDSYIEEILLSDSSASLLKKGEMFDADILQNERVRITTKLKSRGYYYFVKEFIQFDADTSAGSYHVNIDIIIQNNEIRASDGNMYSEKHKRYIIDTVFYYTDYDPKLSISDRNSYFGSFDTVFYSGNYFIYNNILNIKPKVLLRTCYLNSGDVYDVKEVDKTYSNLSGLRTFRLVNIQFSEKEKNRLNCYIQLTPLSKQSYNLEAEGTNSSGNLGLAGNFIYTNRNLFKRAQLFDLKIRGAIEKQSAVAENSSDQLQPYLPFNTVEIGAENKLSFPNFLFPFTSEQFKKRKSPKTSLVLAYNFQRRPDYTRTISNISFGYSWYGNKNLKHFFNPAEINYVNLPSLSEKFRNSIKGTFLESSYTNHFVGVTSYGFIYNDPNLGTHRDILYVRGMVETAGNAITAANKIFNTEADSSGYKILKTVYAQFVKGEIDFRYYRFVSKGTKLAYRIFGGMGVPYGNLKVLPFEKRYFCGGANSIRAWPVRGLGPGSFNDSLKVPNMTADIKLEANFEYRFKLVWVIEGALFADAGNIWDLTKNPERPSSEFQFNKIYNDIAIGYGIGFRLDFSFFVFRLDWALKGRDPSQKVGERWIHWHRKISPQDYSFNFGIGYPF